jgi:hypothetical protein
LGSGFFSSTSPDFFRASFSEPAISPVYALFGQASGRGLSPTLLPHAHRASHPIIDDRSLSADGR